MHIRIKGVAIALLALALAATGCGKKSPASETPPAAESQSAQQSQPAPEPAKTEGSKEPASAPPADAGGGGDAAKGKDIYGQKCAACHGANGEGGVGPAFVAKDGKQAVAERMSEADHIKVVADGKNAMPAFKGQLTDDDIKNVIAYERSLK